MRLFWINCLLLASVVAALPNERHKRDLSTIKNWIRNAFFGRQQINIQPILRTGNEYKLYRLPGFDDDMIRVVPRTSLVKEFVYPELNPVNLNAFGSVVGTKSNKDTLVAVKKVNNMLRTGILHGNHNNVLKESVSPMFPTLHTANYVAAEKIKPVSVIEERPVLKESFSSMFPTFNTASYVAAEKIKPVQVIKERPVLQESISTMFPTLNTANYATAEKIQTVPVIEERPVLQESISTMIPTLNTANHMAAEKIKPVPVIEERPVLKESFSSRFPTLNTANYVAAEKINTFPVIEERPILEEEIKPYEEKIELKVPFEPKYLYTQTQNNEPVMTYTAHNNPNVKVVETFTKTELPMCIKKRIDDVIVLGANPNILALGQEVYQFQPSQVVDISYPSVETNTYIQNPTYGRIVSERIETGANSRSSIKLIKDSHIRHHARPIKSQAINPRPVTLYSRSSDLDVVKTTTSKENINSLSGKTYAFTNSGNKVDLSRTLGPIPSQYSTSNVSKRTKVNPTNVATIIATKDNISNGMIPDNVYNSQSNPNTGKTAKESDAVKTDVKTNTNYYFAPSAKNRKESTTQITKKKDGADINNVTTQTILPPTISSSNNSHKEKLLEENEHIFFKGNPTVVPDIKTYSYQKKNADGSSLSIVGNKLGVMVDVKESKSKSRGDIPDE